MINWTIKGQGKDQKICSDNYLVQKRAKVIRKLFTDNYLDPKSTGK